MVPRRVTKVAVIGGGLMGSGISTALMLSNYPVILKEVNEKFLQAGIGRVKGEATILINIKTCTLLSYFQLYFLL
jgi:3-hydroxyacyl-CoA dehydrogenase